MGQLHLGVGTRYERDGGAFLVQQVLQDGRLVVEDQSGGGHEVVTREEVTAVWAEGGAALRGAGDASPAHGVVGVCVGAGGRGRGAAAAGAGDRGGA